MVGVAPGRAWMVAAHGWDVMGAKRVRMSTAWIARKEGRLLSTMPGPDVSANDLLAAAGHILRETAASR